MLMTLALQGSDPLIDMLKSRGVSLRFNERPRAELRAAFLSKVRVQGNAWKS